MSEEIERKIAEIIDNDGELAKICEEMDRCLKNNILRAIISNPRKKDGITKIKIRQVMINDELKYQATEYRGTQVFHGNYDDSGIKEYMTNSLFNSFKQCEIITDNGSVNILISKKGKATIQRRSNNIFKIIHQSLEHDRVKNYILKEGIPVPFLIDLGVMTKEGKVIRNKYDKFRQVNRFLEFIKDIKEEFPEDREINIIDFGCGKSYLTFAIYYYLHILCGYDVRITGLDLKKDVIESCNRLSRSYGYDKLIFKMGDIAEYEANDNVDMVVTLHACDTATDYALYKAVTWNAGIIFSVPCCQHELNRQIGNELLKPVLGYGILKERMAAIVTDAIRAEVLKTKGYSTEILEFIDMEHTPKNLLIRAVKSKEKGSPMELERMIKELNVNPKITELFGNEEYN